MRRLLQIFLLCLAVLALMPATAGAQNSSSADWRAHLAAELPLLGHRNWIVVVDSAYPLQTAAGIETIDTGAPMLEVVQSVLSAINHTPHMRPVLLMDAELAHVPEADAPGVGTYRAQISELLKEQTVHHQLHEKLIANLAQQSEQFHVLVLKTTATVPYSSVFIQLDCSYWSDEAEIQLRTLMNQARPK